MKKILISIIAMLGIFSVTSCGDMLDTDYDSGVMNPGLNNKTDSVFYALGIAQAIQQLADQYFFVGEMRGELVTTTATTNTHLRALADYSATSANKYDSAYVYYKVINNCNYYLANRDTTLYTGSTNVTLEEYAAVAAWRAWAYLQLARTYGGNETPIPFFTQPLTAISQIDERNFPKKTLNEIVDELAPTLKRFSGLITPTFGSGSVNIGSTNWGILKSINPQLLFVPVDVVLGEMYLEAGKYSDAAMHYSKFLCDNEIIPEYISSYKYIYANQISFPEDFGGYNQLGASYSNIFASTASPLDVATYIPMAVSSQRGQTTDIPLAFGYDYYSTDRSSTCPRTDNIQITPSSAYYTLTDSADFYYYPTNYGTSGVQTTYPTTVKSAKLGDGRAVYASSRGNYSGILVRDDTDTTKVYISKLKNANVYLFRETTIYLHLAEALNRLGYPELAFAILRNGISTYLEELVPSDTSEDVVDGEQADKQAYKYMTTEAINLLKTPIAPFLDAKNRNIFDKDNGDIFGIHCHGGGTLNYTGIENLITVKGSQATAVGSAANLLYLPKPIIGAKIEELRELFPDIAIGSSKEDYINAMEDVLCDEYAKEFAFEGIRFYDLQRIARHKNESGLYGGDFGSRWFANKLAGNNPKVSLLNPKNWYMPLK